VVDYLIDGFGELQRKGKFEKSEHGVLGSNFGQMGLGEIYPLGNVCSACVGFRILKADI
jgi:hypothetical protein